MKHHHDPEREQLNLLIGKIAASIGCSVPELRLDLAERYCKPKMRPNRMTGEVETYTGSLSDLSPATVPTLAEVLAQVQAWAKEKHGVELTDNVEENFNR